MNGGAAVASPSYPLSGGTKGSREGESAEYAVLAPIRHRDSLGTESYVQEVRLLLRATEERAPFVAEEVMRVLADSLAFASKQKVDVRIDDLVNTPPGVDDPAGKLIMVRRPARPSQLVSVPQEYIGFLWDRIGDAYSDRGRRIVRAIRWLRRSYGASDEIEAFSFLAFGLEAIADLLPDPPPTWLAGIRKSKMDDQPPAEHGERIRYFAIEVRKLLAKDWKNVGGLRHALFHGGLSEDADTLFRLGAAIPIARTALIACIKEVSGIPHEMEPHDTELVDLVGPVTITFSPPFGRSTGAAPEQ